MKLTKLIVNTAVLRMQVAMTGLSITRALTMHACPLISARQAGSWIDTGREYAARGLSSDDADLPEETRLCLRLYEADSKVAGEAQLKVGQAKRRILESEDPKMAGAQVQLIKHIDQALAPELFTPRSVVRHEGAPTSQFTFTQEQLDLLTRDELELIDTWVAERAALAEKIATAFRTAEARAGKVPAVH